MLYSGRNSLEDKVVQILLSGPSTIKGLHSHIAAGEKISLRAVYKATDALIEERVIFKVGKQVWINQQWVRALREHLSPSLPPLALGEQVAYTFTSVEHLDIFWKTIAFQFEEYEKDGQIFFYNPHNFWAYIPELQESEDEYYVHFAKTKKHAFFTVGGTTHADREFKRKYQDEFLQIDTRTVPSLGCRDHTTVLGDFIITARLSTGLAKLLDELYEQGELIETILPSILTAYKKDSRVRLTFEHNATKAKKLRTLLSKNFVLK